MFPNSTDEINTTGIAISSLYVVARAARSRMSSHRASDWLKKSNISASTFKKKVAVVVSCYKNVHPRCLDSIANQQYTGSMSVIVVDDGSPNQEELKQSEYSKYENIPGWTFIYKKRVDGENGKKKAQQTAIESREWGEDDLILFLDADSYLAAHDAVASLVTALEDPMIGGVGARLDVANPDVSWITRFQVEEYFQTFQSKAVESSYKTVSVVSGACSMWEWKVLEQIFESYLTGPATGDENTLSYLALKANFGTSIVPAVVKTEVPKGLKRLVIQQVRWLRSDCMYVGKNYRLLYTNKKAFLLFNMTVELFTPLLLLLMAVSCMWQGASGAVSPVIQETTCFLLMMAFDSVTAWRTATSKGKDRLRFSLLYPLYVLLFSLIRIWAFLTCKREVWISH